MGRSIINFLMALLFVGAFCSATAQTIPRSGPPAPVEICSACGAISTGNTIVTNWVYTCEYQTNVNGLVTEYRTVNVTNGVVAYPKMLVFRVESREDMTEGVWEPTGQEFLMKIGTNDMEFYRVKAAIE